VQITEVRIKLMDEPGERLKAFCSITFDNCFVIRDLKIIEGQTGPFVAMPSRKLTAHCPQCGTKNHLRAQHCNQCGMRLAPERMPLDADGRAKLYADIAHPINSACREMIQDCVVREYEEELERAKQPNYVSRYDDFDAEYGEYRRPQPTAGGETRIDPAHERRGSYAGNNRTGADAQRPRGSAPPAPKSAAPRSANRPGDGFGAGIFPEQ
jgi:stage V sporulation protein G